MSSGGEDTCGTDMNLRFGTCMMSGGRDDCRQNTIVRVLCRELLPLF